MVDENKLYKLLVEPCDPDTKKHAKALYKEIVETLKTAEPNCVRCKTPFIEGAICSGSGFTLPCSS